jgi:hypothetical protein
MTNTYPGSNLEIIEKAIYCNEHGDAESCENWLNHLRERVSASAAPAEGREPDAWMVLAANTGKPCEVTLHKSETEALRQDCVVPLYRAEAGREAVDERAACELCKGVGQIGTPGQRCFACDGSGKSLVARAALATAPTPCKGKNCNATNGVSHSPECRAEHAAIVAAADDSWMLQGEDRCDDCKLNRSACCPHLPMPVIATAPTMSEAVRDVLAERRRQVEVEGWTPEHDDEHANDDEMSMAAACYALDGVSPYTGLGVDVSRTWPWAWTWWKPKGRRRNLVKAGALILAELERIDRANGGEGQS